MMHPVQCISYNDIINNVNSSILIEKAFGNDGLGLILLKDFPDFQAERLNLLRAIQKFANLSEDVRNKYSRPSFNYAVGWSHGKEVMKKGICDTKKGSYYVNSSAIESTTFLKEKFPDTYADNIWPCEELPELEIAYNEMMKFELKAGDLILNLVDNYLHQLTGGVHEKGGLCNMIAKSNYYKGRILHYYPNSKENLSTDFDGLCGWHLDHGFLTILLAPLYLDDNGDTVETPLNCGLHVKSRSGEIIQVEIPEDCFAFQLGEMLQYLSGGLLRATAHCVKPSTECFISREQFVLFMSSHPELKIELPKYSLPYDDVIHTPYLPKNIPELKSRLENAVTYRDFSSNSFKAYYDLS